jgi:hypothetical protein
MWHVVGTDMYASHTNIEVHGGSKDEVSPDRE